MFDIALAIGQIINCVKLKNNYMRVCEDKVYGEACPLFGFSTVLFCLPYKEIRYIEFKWGSMVIVTGDKKYYCFIEDQGKAGMLIRERLRT